MNSDIEIEIQNKLSDKIVQEDIASSDARNASLLAFKLDEENIPRYAERIPKRMSIREYVGLDNWKSCDYVLFQMNKEGLPMIIIIEKTDIYKTVTELKIKKKESRHLKKSILKCIKTECICDKNSQKNAADAIHEVYVRKMRLTELASENDHKLCSSLHMLCRLQSDKDFRDILMQDFQYCFIVLNCPSRDSGDEHNRIFVDAELESDLNESIKESEYSLKYNISEDDIETLSKLKHLMDANITSKQPSKVNPDKALKITYGGIMNNAEEINKYLNAI